MNAEIFKMYTVTFDLNGGVSGNDFQETVKVRSGYTVELSVPTREGYLFLGWYTGDGVNEAKFDADDRVSHDMTLTAKWVPEEVTVTFRDYYGNILTSDSVNWGTSAVAPVAPTVPDFRFLKWDRDFDIVTENLSINALYTPAVCTVTFQTSGGETVPTQKVYFGKSPERPDDPVKSGHHFIDWYADEAYTQVYDFNKGVTEDAVIYALFKESKPIYTAEDLKNIASDPYGKYYLANDIDLDGATLNKLGDFNGVLDGEGHKICNFSMSVSGSGNHGIFIINNGTIKNLTVSDFVMSASNEGHTSSAGVIAGVNNGRIENCAVVDGALSCIAKISAESGTKECLFGGVTGNNSSSGVVSGCTVELSITGRVDAYCSGTVYFYSVWLNAIIGGVIGDNFGAIEDCESTCRIAVLTSADRPKNSQATAYPRIGGIVGRNMEGSTAANCAAKEGSWLEIGATGTQYKAVFAGLGFGENYRASVSNCSATGTIFDAGGFNSAQIGGLIGKNWDSLTNSYANVSIETSSSGGDTHTTGGLVGTNAAVISNCYSVGTISSCAEDGIGGLIGRNSTGGSISKCFTACDIVAASSSNVNYFIGVAENSATSFKCYYSTGCTITVNGSAYVPASTAETAKSESAFYGTAFLCDTLSWKTDVWNITGTGLPTLLWEQK